MVHVRSARYKLVSVTKDVRKRPSIEQWFSILTNKQGGQFLKKLWYCAGGDVKHKILDLSTDLRENEVKWAP